MTLNLKGIHPALAFQHTLSEAIPPTLPSFGFVSMNSGTDVLATLSETYKKIFEVPFNSRNKWMMGVIPNPDPANY